MGAVGALVRTSANCRSVATCLRLTKRKASASRTKLVQSEKCRALRFGGFDAAHGTPASAAASHDNAAEGHGTPAPTVASHG